ncbi:lipocalin family protein [Zunongwangia sp. H14]|uniref:lipocalin family protein n=1 Tax=Zunongwangia sp. H14 TaxID=3240792 RepID=UPI003565D1B6
MKNLPPFPAFVIIVFTVLLASCEANRDELMEANAKMTTANLTIANTDLIGTWNMYSMTSIGQNVDFNQDGNYTYDLLEETNCFDGMYFTFKEGGIVNTLQSRLYFTSTGEFTCQTTGNYDATYQVSGDQLTVNFDVDGSNYTEIKTIATYMENGENYLKVSLLKEETNSAVYVANDPGTTVASGIKEIEIIYKKE